MGTNSTPPKARASATATATSKDPRDGAAAAAKTTNPLAPPGASEQDHEKLANSTTGDGAGKPLRPRNKVEDLVSVTVPRGFILTDDDGVQHHYQQGVQDMPRKHADHFYAKANGVEKNED